ncbi:MAG: 3-deoxy-manno-octulosonate cytidylyltransferase [Mariprofundales bacterium]
MKIIVGIPARYASNRFPGKALALLAGKPMIVHVIERALLANIGVVFVATDDERIANVARAAGAVVCLTHDKHPNGASRLAEAIADMDCDVVVNLQGDEPLIDPEMLRAVICPFYDDPDLNMATLAHPLRRAEDLYDANIVKVICNRHGHALYFSRAPIPYPRQQQQNKSSLQHVGLYAYRRDFLLRYPSLPACAAEEIEQLEQLRVLHHGYNIAVEVGDFHSIGVDTPQDLERAEKLFH